jgi:hypothetical protein
VTGPDILFSVLVLFAFLASMADHYVVGQGRINKPLRAFLLGCFIVTESWIALDGKPVVFLYVALNFWGLYWLFLHQKIPLGAVWLKRRRKWLGKAKGHDKGDCERDGRG